MGTWGVGSGDQPGRRSTVGSGPVWLLSVSEIWDCPYVIRCASSYDSGSNRLPFVIDVIDLSKALPI